MGSLDCRDEPSLNRSPIAGLIPERSNEAFFDFCVLQHMSRMPYFWDPQRAQDYRLKDCRTSDSCFRYPTPFTLPFNCAELEFQNFGTIAVSGFTVRPDINRKEIPKMATAKKAAPKAAKVEKKVTAPAKAAKPVAKAAAKESARFQNSQGDRKAGRTESQS
jgi:hypothetical protein